MTSKKDSAQDNQIKELQRQCAEYLTEISQREHKIATLSAQINNLQLQLMQRNSPLSLARQLFNAVDDKIMYHINEHGQKSEPVRTVFEPIVLSGAESHASLLKVAHEYDMKEFFSYRRKVSRSNLKPHYRVVAKAYRVGRDSVLTAGSKVRRALKRREK